MSKNEKILLWSSNVWMFGNGLLGPLFAVFTAEIGGDIFDITTAWAIFMITTGALTILVGNWADKIGHEKLLILGYALNATFTFGYLLVDSMIMLFTVQVGLGVSLALANPTWAALYDKYSDDKQNGNAWGAAYGHSNIATGIAALIGGFIVTYISFKALFLLMGTLQVFATLLQLRLETAKGKRSSKYK